MTGRQKHGPFVDEFRVQVQSGSGGDGRASFRHEPFAPKGGPDGGDGGNGGDVWVLCDESLMSLAHLRGSRFVSAENGTPGASRGQTGRHGRKVELRVPLGTLVIEATEDGHRLIADLVRRDQRILVATGGKGGKGNVHFKTSTDRAPTRCSNGEPGVCLSLVMDLRLIADVAVVGEANAGKSSLVQALTKLPQRVESYPFSTPIPRLAVPSGGSFPSPSFLDFPGLKPHDPCGPGGTNGFLKHLLRCRLILLVLDLRVPVEGPLDALLAEIGAWTSDIGSKVVWVVGNKADLPEARSALKTLSSRCLGRGLPMISVSCETGIGIEELKEQICRTLDFPL